jgi:hypothetical protein
VTSACPRGWSRRALASYGTGPARCELVPLVFQDHWGPHHPAYCPVSSDLQPAPQAPYLDQTAGPVDQEASFVMRTSRETPDQRRPRAHLGAPQARPGPPLGRGPTTPTCTSARAAPRRIQNRLRHLLVQGRVRLTIYRPRCGCTDTESGPGGRSQTPQSWFQRPPLSRQVSTATQPRNQNPKPNEPMIRSGTSRLRRLNGILVFLVEATGTQWSADQVALLSR